MCRGVSHAALGFNMHAWVCAFIVSVNKCIAVCNPCPLTQRQLGLYKPILIHVDGVLPFSIWVVLFQWPGPSSPLIPHIILLAGHRLINYSEMFQREACKECVSVWVCVSMYVCIFMFSVSAAVWRLGELKYGTGLCVFILFLYPMGGDRFHTADFLKL